MYLIIIIQVSITLRIFNYITFSVCIKILRCVVKIKRVFQVCKVSGKSTAARGELLVEQTVDSLENPLRCTNPGCTQHRK